MNLGRESLAAGVLAKAGLPVWLAGFNGHTHAYSGCWRSSFTGGPVRLAQYLGADGFDANAVCP